MTTGISSIAFESPLDGAEAADVGSGLTCSAVISNRCRAVPSGVQVMRVSTGFDVA